MFPFLQLMCHRWIISFPGSDGSFWRKNLVWTLSTVFYCQVVCQKWFCQWNCMAKQCLPKMTEVKSERKLVFLPFQPILQFQRSGFLLKTEWKLFFVISVKNDMKQNYHCLDNLDLATSQPTVHLNLHKQTE